MTAPRRIQLSRKKGWRKPDGTIVVARPSRWGNPWKVRLANGGGWSVQSDDTGIGVFLSRREAHQTAVDIFRHHAAGLAHEHPEWLEELRKALGGHDLACWCPLDMPCHADVLLDLSYGGAA